MVAGAIDRIKRFPRRLTRPKPKAEITGNRRFRKSRAAGNACQSETKKKARPRRPGFLVFLAPQSAG